jgi:trigger factor
MAAAESKTFPAELAGGDHAGEEAQVLVTVNTVKVKELPPLDDDFAQAASEYDTVGELRAGTRRQLEAVRKVGQGGQARERALDALLEQVDMPLPERIVEQEIEHRRENIKSQLDRAGLTMKSYLESTGQTAAQLSASFEEDARRSLKAQFILDKLAADEELKVTAEQLSAYVAEQAYRMGVTPDRLAKQLSDNGQLGAIAGDVLRSNALTMLAERARVVDEAGRPVYIAPAAEAAEDDEDGEETDDDDVDGDVDEDDDQS